MKLEGSWPALFDAVDEHFKATPARRRAICNLYEAVCHLVEVCPEDNLMQVAARRGGRVISGADDANSALQMMRVTALLELMRESQKEKGSLTAYKRAQKALLALGIDNPHAVNLVMYTLSYHVNREGQPFAWLADKLDAPKQKGK